MLDRLVTQRLRQSKKSFLLLGARQVGKSTLCKSLNPQFSINLADEGTFLRYSKDADLINRELSARNYPGPVFIDEIQRLPSLLNTVQAIMDERKHLRFFLTGS